MQWLPIPSCPGYSASAEGFIRGPSGRVLRPAITWAGYAFVGVSVNGKRQGRYVHSLVMEAFAGLRPDGHEIDHIDGVRLHNSFSNLRYARPAENRARHRTGPPRKLSLAQVARIKGQLAAGTSILRVAKEHSVSVALISQIKTGQAWRDGPKAYRLGRTDHSGIINRLLTMKPAEKWEAEYDSEHLALLAQKALRCACYYRGLSGAGVGVESRAGSWFLVASAPTKLLKRRKHWKGRGKAA